MSHDYSPAVLSPVSVASILNPDYGEIDHQLMEWLEEQYGTLRHLIIRTTRDLVRIGLTLADVKRGLTHQEFLAFIDALGLSRATAYRWMAAATAAIGCSHVENVALTALCALAVKSTPEEVREAFLKQADAGQRVTLQEVQATLQQHRPAKPQPAPNLVEKLVDGMVEAEDAGVGRDWRGHYVRAERIRQEIERFREDARAEVAATVYAWGQACIEAATPYLEDGGAS